MRATVSASGSTAFGADDFKCRFSEFLSPPTITRSLAEYVARGEGERLISDKVFQAYAALSERRSTLVEAITDRSLGNVVVIAEDICAMLRNASTLAAATAAEREAEPDQNPDDVARFADLTDKKRLSAELNAVVARLSVTACRRARQMSKQVRSPVSLQRADANSSPLNFNV